MNTGFLLVLLYQCVWLSHSVGTDPVDYYQLNWREFYALTAARKIIDLHQPDYQLLDAALFHATNEAREKENRPVFLYSPILHNAAAFHSQSMIDLDFYGHYNTKNAKHYFPQGRIAEFGGTFHHISENVAKYDILNLKPIYCPEKSRNGEFQYLDCTTGKPFPAYTYLHYAQRVVDGWMNSEYHRRNLLNSDYQYVGCAARISKDPYQQRKSPFACLTQNFGGFILKPQAPVAQKETDQ